jgi:Glycosyl transferase family 2
VPSSRAAQPPASGSARAARPANRRRSSTATGGTSSSQAGCQPPRPATAPPGPRAGRCRRPIVALIPAFDEAVVYLDADGEYPPGDLDRLAAPVLDGTADYVIGSRFAATAPRSSRSAATCEVVPAVYRELNAPVPARTVQIGQSGPGPEERASPAV